MTAAVWMSILSAAIVAMLPLLFASAGTLLSDRVGVFNYGVEGVMLMGAVVGFIAAFQTSSPLLGLLIAAVVGGTFTCVLYALPVVYLRASPLLMSFALWFIGVGLSGQIGVTYLNQQLPTATQTWSVPLLRDIPVLGPVLFEQVWPSYVAVVLLVVIWWLLLGTRHGLSLRSLGEDPGAAFAAGVAVQRLRVLYVSLGGALMGIGGAILSVVIVRTWLNDMVAGRGFIAIALVIVASWRPMGILWVGGLFGLSAALANFGQVRGWEIPSEMLSMAPYILTIVALTVQSTVTLVRRGGSPAPAALGSDFYRGQR